MISLSEKKWKCFAKKEKIFEQKIRDKKNKIYSKK